MRSRAIGLLAGVALGLMISMCGAAVAHEDGLSKAGVVAVTPDFVAAPAVATTGADEVRFLQPTATASLSFSPTPHHGLDLAQVIVLCLGLFGAATVIAYSAIGASIRRKDRGHLYVKPNSDDGPALMRTCLMRS